MTFLNNVKEFRSLGALPATLCSEDISAEELIENKAKWHKAFHLKFAASKLERTNKSLEDKRKGNDDQCLRKAKRTSQCFGNNCILCSEGCGVLHSCCTLELDENVREMTTKLDDTELMSRIAGGDFNCHRGLLPQ